MDLELFDLAGRDPAVRFSPYCWRIKLALAHKGLSATTEPVRFCDKDKIAFSGQGLVPVLRARDNVVSDSWRIALWLDETYPQSPLFEGPQAIGLANFVRAWSQASLTMPVFKTIILDLYNSLDPADREYFRSSREKCFGTTLEAFRVDPEQGRGEIARALAPMREALGAQDFLSGAAPSFADYCAFGPFMWARSVSPIELLAQDDPVHGWRERMLDLYCGMGRNAPTSYSV